MDHEQLNVQPKTLEKYKINPQKVCKIIKTKAVIIN